MTTTQHTNDLFLTDGGLETCMIFHEGLELPLFAAFTLLDTEEGRDALNRYYDNFIQSAKTHNTGFIIDTPTWRASKKWCKEMGLGPSDAISINHSAVDFCKEVKARHADAVIPLKINGAIGPEDDGYNPDHYLSKDEAKNYHYDQVKALRDAGVDSVAAVTMTYVEEAVGIANAAQELSIPAVISFTVETDGNLPSGQSLKSAIEQVDDETDTAPVYYMINCAHPDHFNDALSGGEPWLSRIGAVRANASRMSHEELDNAEELDAGDPIELAKSYRELMAMLPNLQVLGGCCGTDHRHIHEIGKACTKTLA